MSLLKNKIAVVTGGSSGIGLATAKRFVGEGAYVFIAGRRQAELDKAVAEIGENVTAIEADVSKLDDLDRLYKTVAEQKGRSMWCSLVPVTLSGYSQRTSRQNILSLHLIPRPVEPILLSRRHCQ